MSAAADRLIADARRRVRLIEKTETLAAILREHLLEEWDSEDETSINQTIEHLIRLIEVAPLKPVSLDPE